MLCEKVLKYLQSFFKKFSRGFRDYEQMLPGQSVLDLKDLNLIQPSRKRGTRKYSI